MHHQWQNTIFFFNQSPIWGYLGALHIFWTLIDCFGDVANCWFIAQDKFPEHLKLIGGSRSMFLKVFNLSCHIAQKNVCISRFFFEQSKSVSFRASLLNWVLTFLNIFDQSNILPCDYKWCTGGNIPQIQTWILGGVPQVPLCMCLVCLFSDGVRWERLKTGDQLRH